MSDIFSISRFRMASDGPGISTLIGIPRCHLNSLWIIDIKDLDPDIYYRYTHGQVDLMWHNLMYLVQHAPYGQDSIRGRVFHIPG